jgi:glucose/mannose transport system substrate-binding protein
MPILRPHLFSALLCIALPAHADNVAEVAHWWVSEGERASIEVIRRHTEAKGLAWRETAFAGSGTSRYMDMLKQRIANGQPPMATQVIGYDIHEWASQGKLVILDDIAAAEEWDEVVPYGIQHLSKYQGHWVAAPINAHSTNWLWINHTQLARLGMAAPDTWSDLIEVLDKAKAAGLIPLAIGSGAWEHTLLFEAVAVGAGGAEFYRRAFLELDPSALDESLTLRIFQRMSQLRGYLDSGFHQRSWDQATDLVRSGRALLQVQGSWVDGEFAYHRLVPGEDYDCLRFPDTQGVFLFNSDQYMLLRDHPADERTRRTFISTLMSIDLQRELSITTGAAPARVDVPRDSFNACGRQAISDMRGANMRRTMMGSIAMGNANPSPVKSAIYQVVSEHLLGQTDDTEASRRLRAVINTHAQTAREQQP